jgi:hypothetical protein
MRVTSFAEVETEGRLVRYVLADIRSALAGIGLESDEGDWSPTFSRAIVWPDRVRWVSAYVVRGSNEGWYAHLDAIPEGIGANGAYSSANVNLAIAKFWDRDLAFEYCKRTMQLLEGD